MKLVRYITLSITILGFMACSIPAEKSGISDPNQSDTRTDNNAFKNNNQQAITPRVTSEVEENRSSGILSHFQQPTQVLADRKGANVKSKVSGIQNNPHKQRKKESLSPASGSMPLIVQPSIAADWEPVNRENYQHLKNNPIFSVHKDPVSTFAIDVDTASYANVRRMINQGMLPPSDAVRVEEFINYFSYDYPTPSSIDTPLNLQTEIGPSPWSKDRYLLHIGIKGYEVSEKDRPPVNLVFLIDVSGSMQSSNKLPLLKKSLTFLVNKMRPQDHVAIAVYAGASGLVLPPTSGSERSTILTALNNLQAGGSTNGAAGIRLAYQTAMQHYDKNASNLVLLATDGDFNVGTVNFNQLIDLIKEKRKSGIAISTLGFGAGNYNDHLAEQIADAGNGSASYIDSLQEAKKVLVDHIGSALIPIARDTKAQIEFNPQWVSEYRLIGYENRHLENHEFNMDSVDAGDLFSGHTVTAIYEIALLGRSKNSIDPLRYSKTTNKPIEKSNEIAFLKIRYKPIGNTKSSLIRHAIESDKIKHNFTETSRDFQFSASVAAYGQMLRNSPFISELSWNDISQIAKTSKGDDDQGYRAAFVSQITLTRELQDQPTKVSSRQ